MLEMANRGNDQSGRDVPQARYRPTLPLTSRSLRIFWPVIWLLIYILGGVFLWVGPAAKPPACASQAIDIQLNPQCAWIIEIENERSALTEGYLLYPASLDVDVNHPVDLNASLYSPAAYKQAQATGRLPELRMTQTQIGGDIRAQLTSDMPGSTSAQSSEDQPIIGDGDIARWTWHLVPSRPGRFQLTLTFNVLRGGSSSLLTPDADFEITLNVHRTSTYLVSSVWHTIIDFFAGLGGILSAIGITAAAVVLWLVRHLRKRPHNIQTFGRRRLLGARHSVSIPRKKKLAGKGRKVPH